MILRNKNDRHFGKAIVYFSLFVTNYKISYIYLYIWNLARVIAKANSLICCLMKPLIFHERNNVSRQKMKDGSAPLQPCQNL